MTSKKLYLALIVIISLLGISLVVGAFNINKVLVARADKLTQLKAKSSALAQEQVIMKKAKQDIQSYAELQKITRTIVPEDKSQAEAVREIVKIANGNDVSLSAINFPASTLGNTGTGAISPAPAAAAPAAGASPASAKSLSQLLPVKNIPGVYQLLITVQSDTTKPVRYDKFVNFLSALERNRRTAQVSNITIEPDKNNRNFLSFTLALNEYIKP